MSIVMGIDSDKAMGWAIYDVRRPPSAIESGSLKLEGDTMTDRIVDMRLKLVPLIKKYRPIFAAIEMPRSFLTEHKSKGGTMVKESPATIVKQGEYVGAACAIFACWNIRPRQVAPNTWQTIIPDNFKREFDDTKDRAAATCNLLRIVSPNMSSRDASLIAFWAAGDKEFKHLLQQRQRAA